MPNALETSMAREQIRDLISRYNVAGDGHDREAMMATFASDALYESVVFQCEGLEAISSYFDRAWKTSPERPGPRFRRHHITTTQIDLVSDSEATGMVYYLVVTDLGPDHCGYYRDRYRLTPQGWKFAYRGVWMEWAQDDSRFVPERAKRALRETGTSGPAG